jgi:undecaprenyl-diphosphatase
MNDKHCLILFTVITLLAIILELLFKNELIELSYNFTKYIQSHSSSTKDTFVDILTKFGTYPAFIPIIILVCGFFPINESATYIFTFSLTSYINNLLKIIYSEHRPFWEHPDIFRHCSSGYGKTSGHAMESTIIYLSLWKLFSKKKFFEKQKIAKNFFLIFLIWLIVIISLTRVYIGVHSINQIMLGMVLGSYIYYFIYVYLDILNIELKDYFSFFKNKKYIFRISLMNISFMILLLIVYIARDPNTLDYDEIIRNLCPSLNYNNMYKNESLHKGSLIVLAFGLYFGIVYSLRRLEDYMSFDTYNNWNRQVSFKEVSILALLSIPGCLYFLISADYSLIIVLLFKIIVPAFCITFNTYGLGFEIIFKQKYKNNQLIEPIYKT